MSAEPAANKTWGARRDAVAEYWDWNPLYGSCEVNGRNVISPSDIDFCIERNGRFLIFEAKQSHETLSRGQEIMLFALARLPAAFTVYVITAHQGTKTPARWTRMLSSGEYGPMHVGGWPELREVVAHWFQWANAQRRT